MAYATVHSFNNPTELKVEPEVSDAQHEQLNINVASHQSLAGVSRLDSFIVGTGCKLNRQRTAQESEINGNYNACNFCKLSSAVRLIEIVTIL